MAPYERGTNDDMRVFDGGEDESESEGSSLAVVIVICLFVLAAFGGVVWLAYNQGVAHGRGDGPGHTVQTAANDQPAAAPDSSDGGQKPIKIYQQPAGPDEAADQGQATAPPAQLNKAAPPPAAPASEPAAKPAPAASEPGPSQADKQKLTAMTEAAQTSPPPAPREAAKTEPKPVPKQEAATASEAPKRLSSAAAGAYVLQIGAYKSEADAETAWKAYAAKHAGLLAGTAHEVQKADLGAKGIWYRLRAGSFASQADASAMCDKLKADGGACFPAK